MEPLSPHRDSYRLVVISPPTRKVFAESQEGTWRLPRISIPRKTRVVERIQASLKLQWGFSGIVIDIPEVESGRGPLAIVEGLVTGDSMRAQSSCLLDDLDPDELSVLERCTIDSLLDGRPTNGGRFCRFGWIDEELDWITTVVHVGRSALLKEIRQYNAGANFALLRFGQSDRQGYWLKAVGEPNLREFSVTLGLARTFTDFLPTVVASRREWNEWLMKDAGKPLSEVRTLSVMEQTVTRLAELQQASAAETNLLLSQGCFDQRSQVLRSRILAVMDYLEEAMSNQVSCKVPRLRTKRLREIAWVLEEACFSLEAIEIPSTLLHNDINPGNILVGSDKVVFTDWAEASVGNPFVTFELFRVQVAADGRMQQWVPRLIEVYRRSWREILSDSQIEHAFAMAPLIAIFSYLYGRGDWLSSERRYNPRFQSYARSLARRMDRAAQVLEQGMLRCV